MLVTEIVQMRCFPKSQCHTGIINFAHMYGQHSPLSEVRVVHMEIIGLTVVVYRLDFFSVAGR
jgi:hypothetical protein